MGAGLAWQEGELVAWRAFLLPVALAVAVAEAVALAVLVALLLAVAVEVAVAVPVAAPVAEVLPLAVGRPLVAPLLPGLRLEMPLDGAVPEPVGGTLGSALLDLADLDGLADEGGQAVACELLLWLADEL